ncbi:hypothetical protein [Pectobacterium carotovorum]|uniref:hypothetical protein n=1 Tax=Pectobacterium carotovorum TaxID=554 RepID=UPI00301A8B29
MPATAMILGSYSALLNTLNAFKGSGRENVKLATEAIRSLTKAIHETEIYFAERGRGLERDRSREVQLSRYWSDAAEPVRLVDPEFSDLCALKAHYWLFPDNYDRESVKSLHITLEGMNAGLQNLRYPQ